MEKRRPSALQEFFQQSQQGNFSPSNLLKSRNQRQKEKPVIRQVLQSIILFTVLVMAFQLIIALMYSYSYGTRTMGNIPSNENVPPGLSTQQKIAQELVNQAREFKDRFSMEVYTLMQFKKTVQNPAALESWSGENPCDGWKGITCENDQITAILLKEEQLYTKIPENFSKLSSLQKLELSSSGMQGVLPIELSVLNLSELYVHLNALEGHLMPQFSAWTNLNSFHIEYNKFSGYLPEEYSSWKNLQNFDITSNQINGRLPSQFSEWKQVNRAQFAYNQFKGQVPLEFSELQKIQVLNLNGQKNDQLCIPEDLKKNFLDKLEENRHDLTELATCLDVPTTKQPAKKQDETSDQLEQQDEQKEVEDGQENISENQVDEQKEVEDIPENISENKEEDKEKQIQQE